MNAVLHFLKCCDAVHCFVVWCSHGDAGPPGSCEDAGWVNTWNVEDIFIPTHAMNV